MKRFYLLLGWNVIVTCGLAFLTISIISKTIHADGAGSNGWLIFSPGGAVTGLAPLFFLLFLFAIDGVWLLFFLAWLAKCILRIKGKDDVVYLP